MFRETVVAFVALSAVWSLDDYSQVFHPDSSLPKELSDFLQDVRSHRTDFQCIRYMANKASRKRKSILDKSAEQLERHKSFLKSLDDYPINDVYPYMYKSNNKKIDTFYDELETNANNERHKRQLNNEVNVITESDTGEMGTKGDKYPDRLVRDSASETSLNSESGEKTNLKRRNVEIEIKENGRLIKEIQEDSKEPKSIVLNLNRENEVLHSNPMEESLNYNSNDFRVSKEKFKVVPPRTDGDLEAAKQAVNEVNEENGNLYDNPANTSLTDEFKIRDYQNNNPEHFRKSCKNCNNQKMTSNENRRYNNGFEEVKGLVVLDKKNISPYRMRKLRRGVDKIQYYDNDILRDYSNDNLYSYRHNNFIPDNNEESDKREKVQKKSISLHHKTYRNRKQKRGDERMYAKSFGPTVNRKNKYLDNIKMYSRLFKETQDHQIAREQKMSPVNGSSQGLDDNEDNSPSEDQKSDKQGELLVGRLLDSSNNCKGGQCIKTRGLKEVGAFYSNVGDNSDENYMYDDKNYDRFNGGGTIKSETTVRVKSQAAEGDYNDEEDSDSSKEKSKKFNHVKKTKNEFANPPVTTVDNSVYDDDDNSDDEKEKSKKASTGQEKSMKSNDLVYFGRHGKHHKRKNPNDGGKGKEKRDLDVDQIVEPALSSSFDVYGATPDESTCSPNFTAKENLFKKTMKLETTMETFPPLTEPTNMITCSSVSDNMKLEDIINGKVPKQIVDHMLSIISKTERYKKFSPGIHKRISERTESMEGVHNINTCNLMSSISKLINTFLETSTSVCLTLPETTRKYLEKLLNVPTNPFTTENVENQNAEYDNHQNDMLFHKNSMGYHENKDTSTQSCDNSYDSLKSKISSLNGLVERYNSMSQKCQHRAKSVKKYIDNHLQMLTSALNSNAKLKNGPNAEQCVPDARNQLIDDQLKSVGLGKDQVFHPNFDVNALVEDEMRTCTTAGQQLMDASNENSVKKRQVSSTRQSKKYKKLLDAVKDRRHKRETVSRIAEIFGNRNRKRTKYETPLVFSLN